MIERRAIVAAALLLLCLPRDGAAQGFINPFVGTTLTSPSASGGSSAPGFGVAFGRLGSVVGFDSEIAYYPEVIDNAPNAIAKSRVISFSGGMLIGPRLGAVTPYFALGAGNLNLNVTGVSSVLVPNPESISNNYFTFNTGGGVMGYFSDHFGVRGDLRYFRAFGLKLDDLENVGGFEFDRFNFWRGYFGLAIKF